MDIHVNSCSGTVQEVDKSGLLYVEMQTHTHQCRCSLAKTLLGACASYMRDTSICVFEYVLAV